MSQQQTYYGAHLYQKPKGIAWTHLDTEQSSLVIGLSPSRIGLGWFSFFQPVSRVSDPSYSVLFGKRSILVALHLHAILSSRTLRAELDFSQLSVVSQERESVWGAVMAPSTYSMASCTYINEGVD